MMSAAAQSSAPVTLDTQSHYSPSTGSINYPVIFVRFSDQPEFTKKLSVYDQMYNDNTPGANSVYNYYQEATYGKLSIHATFYPAPATDGTIISYQDPHPRGYYLPYNASTNPIGYTNDSAARQNALVEGAINAVAATIPPDLTIDSDNDGYVDSVALIISGATVTNTTLWPHTSKLYSDTKINNKYVRNFNIQMDGYVDTYKVGVLAHEFFHSIGAPDLYRAGPGALGSFRPVDGWDLMSIEASMPQHMTAFMKWKYGKWIDSIPVIKKSGTYTLQPLSTSATNSSYRIDSPNSATEYCMVEYRYKKAGYFDAWIPGLSGLLIYRINSTPYLWGNIFGPPDEIFIFRPNGKPTINGIPSYASFSADAGRTSFGDTTNFGQIPFPAYGFLSDGSPLGCNISEVGLVGDTISFKVTLPDLKLFKLTLPQNTLAGEQSETASAMLNVTASEDTQVSLSSDNPLVQVPSTVTVIDGARSGYFPVVAGCVTTPTTATITASYNGGIQTAALALTPETTPPTASIADPGGLARGTKFVTASASDNCGMAGVQFILDGMNLGSQITGSPYTMAWDTTQQTDGPHALVALATDLAGNTATSTVVNYFVDNTPPTLVVPNTQQQLWPPDGRTVLVNLNGTASDLGSGVDSITFKVTDSYGLVQPAVAPIDGAGRNSLDWKISIPLEASRNGWDKDGRVYTIEITARDRAGNMKTVAAYVTVPHDQRN